MAHPIPKSSPPPPEFILDIPTSVQIPAPTRYYYYIKSKLGYFVFSTRNSYLLINEHYLLVIQPLVFLTAAIPAALVAINVSEHRPMERRVRAWVGTHVRAAKRRHGGRFFESTTHIRKKFSQLYTVTDARSKVWLTLFQSQAPTPLSKLSPGGA